MYPQISRDESVILFIVWLRIVGDVFATRAKYTRLAQISPWVL